MKSIISSDKPGQNPRGRTPSTSRSRASARSAGTGTASRRADAQSPVGRTRTAPAADAAGPRLRFAFASCQHYEQGYFAAYRHMAADEPDLVAFLGDYIYESTWGRDHVRNHDAPEPYTLEDYRARYALYKSDPDLQAAHAACPWIVTWDDHEVDNDYADDRPEDGMERAHVPRAPRRRLPRVLRAHAAAGSHAARRARTCASTPTLDWGTLARFYVLDTRQYRSLAGLSAPRPARRLEYASTSSTASASPRPARTHARPRAGALARAARSANRARLERARAADADGAVRHRSRARAARLDRRLGRLPRCEAAPLRYASSSKKASQPGGARRRRPLLQRQPAQARLRRSRRRPWWRASSSAPRSPRRPGRRSASTSYLPDNPHMLLVDSRYRGYVRVEVSPRRWRPICVRWKACATRDAACSTLATTSWRTASRARSAPA